MRFDGNYGGDPNYVGSSIKPTKFYQDVKGTNPAALSIHTQHEKWAGEVSAYTSEITDADFVQPAALWEVMGREPGAQDRLIDNLVDNIKGVKYPELRKAVYGMLAGLFFRRFLCLTIVSNSIQNCFPGLTPILERSCSRVPKLWLRLCELWEFIECYSIEM